jgi:putative ABC transport system substrate-binding protein
MNKREFFTLLAQRYSIAKFWPSTKPLSLKLCGTQPLDLRSTQATRRKDSRSLASRAAARAQRAATPPRRTRVEALLVGPANLFSNRRVQITTLATRHAVPAIYDEREFAEAGGLMSYGTSRAELFRQVGVYVSRILKSEKAADLPVMRATKFEFVINLQTARTFGIETPATLIALADEVIE